MFSLDSRETFQCYYNPLLVSSRVPNMERIAEQIATVCATLGEYPSVRYRSVHTDLPPTLWIIQLLLMKVCYSRWHAWIQITDKLNRKVHFGMWKTSFAGTHTSLGTIISLHVSNKSMHIWRDVTLHNRISYAGVCLPGRVKTVYKIKTIRLDQVVKLINI